MKILLIRNSQCIFAQEEPNLSEVVNWIDRNAPRDAAVAFYGKFKDVEQAKVNAFSFSTKTWACAWGYRPYLDSVTDPNIDAYLRVE